MTQALYAHMNNKSKMKKKKKEKCPIWLLGGCVDFISAWKVEKVLGQMSW
jgi:hypothetical protein